MEDITEADIWRASRCATASLHNGSTPAIPPLRAPSLTDPTITQEFTTAEDKCELLVDTFFPPRPAQVPSLPGDNGPFPTPLPFDPPSLDQVRRCIHKLHPHKARGPDKIPNIVLRNAVELIAPLLHRCLQATLSLKYFPAAWRSWSTIVLQKPGRPDYTTAKAYCPIALYNTMGKVISAAITDVLVYLTVRHSLLPSKCFGGLPGRTTTDSLLYLVHNVKNAWRRKKVVTIIFLDIASAFPNAMTNRLLLNMKRLGYPTKIMDFFHAMLRDRHTTLTFDGYTSAPIPIDNGIGQGEPSSMILYLIYSHALAAIPSTLGGDGGAYVDDTFFWAACDTFEECDAKLNAMLDKQEEWSPAHNSKAETSKFKCLRLTTRANVVHKDFSRANSNLIIKCDSSAKLLGVVVDQQLRWHQHVQYASQKGAQLLFVINRLTRPSFGLPAPYVRHLFTAVVVPKVEYALPVWYTPLHSSPESPTT